MEYVEGTGLREYLARKASFDLPHVASIMTQLLRALDFAHERGVIHRDIKPANLILTADGTLKVADFGIARIDTSNLTTLGMVMGTPSYMSPEQCQGQAVDRRSDLFSAAVVLYELLAGEKPFAGATETIAYKICHESPRPPSALSRLNLSPTIDAVLAVALEKSPDARFQNARAFSRALREALNAPAQQNPDETAATQVNTAISAMRPSIAAPPVWEDTVLRTVERQLAHYVGPMAKVMTRKAATQTADLGKLYGLLAENISDPATREKFSAGMRLAAAPDATSPGHIATGTNTRSMLRQAALEQSFVDQTSNQLAVYLGPIAKVVASRAAQKATSRQEFVRLVAGHLGDQERNTFLKEIGFEEA
jgi:serine/threonine-protein kinase